MNRKFLTIAIVGAVILLLLGGGLVWAISRQNAPKMTETRLTLKKVSDDQVISPVPTMDNSALWYFNQTGQLFRTNLDGSGLTEYPLPSLAATLQSVIWPKVWPKSGSDFLALTDKFKAYYNSKSNLYVNFPANVQSIDYLPDGVRVAYIWQSSDKTTQSLVVANADGTGFKTVASVFWPDLQVKAAPDGKTALLYRSNPLTSVNKIYLVNLDSGTITTAVNDGRNLEAEWLPETDKFIYSQVKPGSTSPEIYLYDLASGTSTDLHVATVLDKIAIEANENYLIAAVPKSDNSGDSFVKVSLKDFTEAPYFSPSAGLRAINLVLVDQTLYFTNSTDGKFYTLAQ